MARKTVLVCDSCGKEVEEGKGAVLRVTFNDARRGANATLSIDLEKQEIRGPDGGVVKFDIDPHRKHCMLNGLDDIGLTMVKSEQIDGFETKVKADRPWL